MLINLNPKWLKIIIFTNLELTSTYCFKICDRETDKENEKKYQAFKLDESFQIRRRNEMIGFDKILEDVGRSEVTMIL